jgi:hypothetical protein
VTLLNGTSSQLIALISTDDVTLDTYVYKG